jgi:hypothetical protein
MQSLGGLVFHQRMKLTTLQPPRDHREQEKDRTREEDRRKDPIPVSESATCPFHRSLPGVDLSFRLPHTGQSINSPAVVSVYLDPQILQKTRAREILLACRFLMISYPIQRIKTPARKRAR